MKMKETVWSQLVEQLDGAISQENSLAISYVVLLHTYSVSETKNGKISLARFREGFLGKSLKTIYTKSFISMASIDGEGIEQEYSNDRATSTYFQSRFEINF
jgi:hypothetical protein